MVTSARWGMLVGDTRKAPTTQRVVLAPNGRFCTDAVLQAIVARHVTKFDEMGYPEDWDGGDFPTFDIYATVHGDPFLEDTEGVEWLATQLELDAGVDLVPPAATIISQ